MILFHSLDMPAENTAALSLIAPTSVSLAYRAPIMAPIEVPPIISIGIPGGVVLSFINYYFIGFLKLYDSWNSMFYLNSSYLQWRL